MTDIRFDLVGFDLDGTLLDTSGDLGAALNHALALAGREPVAMDEVRGPVGGGSRVRLRRAGLPRRRGGREGVLLAGGPRVIPFSCGFVY